MDKIYSFSAQVFGSIFSFFANAHETWQILYWGDVIPGFKEKLIATVLALSLGLGMATLFHLLGVVVRRFKPDAALAHFLNMGVFLFASFSLVLIPGIGFYIALLLCSLVLYAVAATGLDAYRARNRSL